MAVASTAAPAALRSRSNFASRERPPDKEPDTPVSVAAFPEPTKFGPLRRSPSYGRRDRPPPDGGLPCRRVRGRFAFPMLPHYSGAAGRKQAEPAETGWARARTSPHAASRFPARSRRPIAMPDTLRGGLHCCRTVRLRAGGHEIKIVLSHCFRPTPSASNSGPAHPSTEKFSCAGVNGCNHS